MRKRRPVGGVKRRACGLEWRGSVEFFFFFFEVGRVFFFRLDRLFFFPVVVVANPSASRVPYTYLSAAVPRESHDSQDNTLADLLSKGLGAGEKAAEEFATVLPAKKGKKCFCSLALPKGPSLRIFSTSERLSAPVNVLSTFLFLPAMSARREGLRLARALWGGRATIAESLCGPAQGSFAAAEATAG